MVFPDFRGRSYRIGVCLGALACSLLCASHVASCGAQTAAAMPRARSSQKKVQAEALLDQAKQLLQAGDARSALRLLRQSDLHGPAAADVHTLQGICFALLSQPVESAAEFDRAIALRPNYAPTYLSAGLAFASFNNLELALARLSSAMKLDPGLPGLRFNYALVLSRAGQFAESEKNVDLLLAARGPSSEPDIDLLRLKARDTYYQQKWPGAIEAYRQVLALQPDWAEGYTALGEALFHLNRPAESIDALEKAVALDPENGAAHALLGRLYLDAGKDASTDANKDAGKQDHAIAELELAHGLRPQDRETVYRLFRIYTARGDTVNAARLKTDLQTLLANEHAEADSEARASVLNGKGIELERKGDLAGALKSYDLAANTDVTNLIFKRNAALLLCRMGRTREAIQRLHDILSLDPDDAMSLQILSVAEEMAAGGLQKRSLPSSQVVRP